MIIDVHHSQTSPRRVSFLDVATFVWGAVCQQSTNLVAPMSSGKFIILTTFLTALALFTSYAASIVALLQSPSHSIRTVDDLLASPLGFVVQDAPFLRFYYMQSGDPVLSAVYEKKVRPAKEAGWIYDTNIGIENMRTQLMALQVEEKAAYKAIQRTFNDYEKCSLTEMQLLILPTSTITVAKNFPYKELYKTR